MSFVSRSVERIGAFVFPQRCAVCGLPVSGDSLLCRQCLESIPRLSFDLCARCLLDGREPVGCTRHPDHRVGAAWVYDEAAARVVHALKFGARPALAGVLGDDMARAAGVGHADFVIEVPLHRARLRARGYNQAECLARALSERMGCPRLGGVIERSRRTRSQAGLGPAARRRNLAGAFRVTHPSWVRGRRVLVVDDVMTTGATLSACLAALAGSGAHPRGVVLAWAQ